MILKFLGNVYFKIIGWKIEGSLPPDVKKCVMIAAPHTSNHDFPIARFALAMLDVDVKYLAKKELFKFPLGILMRAVGGIAVNRGKHNSLVDAIVELIKSKDKLVVLIPPEGTRKAVKKWKTGFYHAAKGAGVPIALGFLDYKKKIAGIGPIFFPSDDMAKDFEFIKKFYQGITPKFPENYTISFE